MTLKLRGVATIHVLLNFEVDDSTLSFIHRLQVQQVISETTNAKTFVLQPLDGWVPYYQSGQFITLLFQTPNGEKRRSYSVSSSPELGEPLSITVKRVENGEFSRPLVEHTKEGDVFICTGIGGVFTVDLHTPLPCYCFVVAGSGIVPCYSLIKTLLVKTQSRIVLFYSNKNEADTIFYKQLQDLAQQYGQRLVVHYLFSDHTNLYHRRLGKWLFEQLLDRYLLPADIRTSFYLCGPFEFMQMATIVLRNRYTPDTIHREQFAQLPNPPLPEPPDRDAHRVQIVLGKRTETITVQFPVPITKAAKQQGLSLPYSCEAGRCGACIATCTSGRVWMAYNEVLTDREVNAGRILTCQAFPVGGDATIQF